MKHNKTCTCDECLDDLGIRGYMARIGAKGGGRRTREQKRAARENFARRWKPRIKVAIRGERSEDAD